MDTFHIYENPNSGRTIMYIILWKYKLTVHNIRIYRLKFDSHI